jgi:GxxExxY protein
MNTNRRDIRANPVNIGDELLFRDEVFAIVGAAMEVHNTLGAGFLESVYQEAMEIELAARQIPFRAQYNLAVNYKGKQLAQCFLADIYAFDLIIVELKAVSMLTGPHHAQLLNYLRASACKVGLLINFGPLNSIGNATP